MPQLTRLDLDRIVTLIRNKASEECIQQLKTLGISGGKVAHLGCAQGTETLALMWVLDAVEVYGIDGDIARAEGMFSKLREWIQTSKSTLPYVSREDYWWWEDTVPDFLKEERFPILIQERDIAHPVRPFQLPSNYFDLACSSHLLCQTLEKGDEGDVRSAVEEMKRIVKPEGWVVAEEPDHGTPGRFRPIFEGVGLEPFKVTSTTLRSGEGLTTYCYRKRRD